MLECGQVALIADPESVLRDVHDDAWHRRLLLALLLLGRIRLGISNLENMDNIRALGYVE